jgi:hypothetical protein
MVWRVALLILADHPFGTAEPAGRSGSPGLGFAVAWCGHEGGDAVGGVGHEAVSAVFGAHAVGAVVGEPPGASSDDAPREGRRRGGHATIMRRSGRGSSPTCERWIRVSFRKLTHGSVGTGGSSRNAAPGRVALIQTGPSGL